MNAWEVWFASFPYEEDSNIVKNRPVIILDVEKLEVLSTKITSHDIRENDPFDTSIIYWREAGLNKPSVARVAKTFRLHKDNFAHKIGDLQEEDCQAIAQAYADFMNSTEE